MIRLRRLLPRTASLFFMLSLLATLLCACSTDSRPSRQVTLSLGSPVMSDTESAQSAQTTSGMNALLLALLNGVVPPAHAAPLESVYPYLSRVTLKLTADGYSSDLINRDYNDGRFLLEASEDALLLTDTNVTLQLPSGVDITFLITAYSLSGVQYMTGSATLLASAAQSPSQLVVGLRIDIDPAIPRFASVSGCPDSDGDDLCDSYEDLFVTASGVSDIDGDGISNSLDTDADGDGVSDDADGNAPSNDGYPFFIHANQPPTAVALAMLTAPGTAVTEVPLVTDPDEGDSFTVTIVTQGQYGLAEAGAGGGILYTPYPGYSGVTDVVRVRVTDRGGLFIEGDITISISGVSNQPPVAQDDGVQTVSRSSLANSGAEGSGHSDLAALNENGRYVAFWSEAADLDLVTADTNGAPDIFVRDMMLNTLSRVTMNDQGAEASYPVIPKLADLYAPSMSYDGRYIVFESSANNLGYFTDGTFDVYRRDVTSGTTLSITQSECWADAESREPRITPDGSSVVFTSASLTFVCGNTSDGIRRIIYTGPNASMATYGFRRVSVNELYDPLNDTEEVGNVVDGDSYHATIDDSGSLIAFASHATNLLKVADTNGVADIYLKNLADESVTLLSVDSSGTPAAGGDSDYPAISGDGRVVAFSSAATNLVAGDANGVSDIFVRDLQAGTTNLISGNSLGQSANGASVDPAISKDGRYVVFSSSASDLVVGDSNGVADIFIHDTLLHETRMLSSSGGVPGNGGSYGAVLSGNGQHVAVATDATNLLAGDSNWVRDIQRLTLTDIVAAEGVAITTPNLLANDTDPDGDALTVVNPITVANGSVVNNGNGTLTYTPANGYLGMESIGYTVVDGFAASDSATVRIAVNKNYPPQGVDDGAVTPIIVDALQAEVMDYLLDNDFDLDNDDLTIFSADATSSLGGSVVVDASRKSITYTPPTSGGADSFTYIVTDGVANSAPVTVSILAVLF